MRAISIRQISGSLSIRGGETCGLGVGGPIRRNKLWGHSLHLGLRLRLGLSGSLRGELLLLLGDKHHLQLLRGGLVVRSHRSVIDAIWLRSGRCGDRRENLLLCLRHAASCLLPVDSRLTLTRSGGRGWGSVPIALTWSYSGRTRLSGLQLLLLLLAQSLLLGDGSMCGLSSRRLLRHGSLLTSLLNLHVSYMLSIGKLPRRHDVVTDVAEMTIVDRDRLLRLIFDCFVSVHHILHKELTTCLRLIRLAPTRDASDTVAY